MKKILSAVAALALGGGLALAAVMPASATPTIPAEYCSAIYETQPNPAYVPEVLEVTETVTVEISPEVAEVSHTQYLYKQIVTGKTKWLDAIDWNPGLGWYYTGQTQVVIDVAYQAAVTEERTNVVTPYSPAIGEPTVQVFKGDWCEGWFTSSTTFLTASPQSADDVSWPQTILGAGKLAPECGVQVQQDFWAGWREQIEAILADGILSRINGTPEDSQVVKDWTFAEGPVCEIPPTVVASEEPGFTDICTSGDGPSYTLTLPETVGVNYDVQTDTELRRIRVVATATEGNVLASGEDKDVYHYEYTDEACPAEEPPVEEPPVEEPEPPVEEPVVPAKVAAPVLPNTGVEPSTSWLLVSGLLALIAGGSIGAYRLSKRTN